MLKNYISLLLRFRYLVLSILIFVTIIFGYFLTKVNVDNDTFKAIPPHLKAKIDYDILKQNFSAPYTVLFLAEFKSGTLLEKIDSLQSWEKEISGINGISGVTDLNTVQIPLKGGFFGITSDYLISHKQSLEENELRDRIKNNKEFSKIFISDDESIFGMIIGLQNGANRSNILKNIISKVEQINSNSTIKSYITSEGAISYFIDQAMRKDFRLLLPICMIVVFFLLYRIFRSVLYVCTALLVNVFALLWTFGLMGMLHVPFSVVTAIIPVILFPIGVADAIHLLKSFKQELCVHHGRIEDALTSVYKELLMPCLLTSLTTFAGFASFAFSSISWTRTFGIFTGIAIMLAYIFNIMLIPVFLSFDKKATDKPYKETSEEIWLDKFWDLFAKYTLESKKWMILIPILTILCIIGFRMVRVESNPITMLPQKSMLRLSDDFIGKHFGGTRFFSVVIDSKDEKMSKKEQWEKVQNITAFIQKQNGVGNVTSVLPLLYRLSSMLSNEKLSNAAISMLTSSKSFFGDNYMSYINGFISENRTKTRLQVTCMNDPAVKPLVISDNIRQYVKKNYPDWDILISGPAILNESMSAVLISTQIGSLISTFIPVFLCLVVFLKSFRVGIFSIIPIIIATAFIYAMMGISHVTINLVTVIIMNTCIGIGVDYSIHFVSGYLHYSQNDPNRNDVLKKTIRNKGTPIMFNTLVVGIGFLILAFSSFPPIKDFGLLVFISMFVSAGFSILFLSLLISKLGMGKHPVPVRKDA